MSQLQKHLLTKQRIATAIVLGGSLVGGSVVVIRALIRFIRLIEKQQQELENRASDPKVRKKIAVDIVFFGRLLRLLRVLIPSPFCREVIQLFLLTVALLCRTSLTLKVAEITGRNAKELVSRNREGFIKGVIRLALFAVPASVVNSSLKYLTALLQLNFRKRLSRDLHNHYLNGMAFYKVSNLGTKIDNIDQRITQDVEKFAGAISTVYGTTFTPVLDIILLSGKLALLTGLKGPLMMYLYYVISGLLLRLIMPPFPKLISEQQKLEGDYRYVHSRLINYAEEVAFYGAQKKEKQTMDSAFERLYKHSSNIFKKQAWLGVIDSWLVKYGATMIGYAVVAGPVFGSIAIRKRHGEAVNTSQITGDYVRNSHILINLAKAIGQLIVLYKSITQLAGYTARVSELREVLLQYSKETPPKRIVNGMRIFVNSCDDQKDEGDIDDVETRHADDAPNTRRIESDYIAFKDVSIVSPDGVTLVESLSFEVHPGQNLLISGPNGCGKSSVFRILSGLWPLHKGVVVRPPVSSMFYIPQRPYMTIGTLRDQVLYPHHTKYGSSTFSKKHPITDEQLNELMRQVELSYLVAREGWDKENDWNEVLSQGEQQRIAMARLFYHSPKYAILDECTSQLSLDIEAFLYQRCKELGITLITVAHRKSVWKYHDLILKFDGKGNYEFRPLSPKEIEEASQPAPNPKLKTSNNPK
jgi:ATP-binding cassette subfamily D (ALD) protein 3